MSLQIIIQEVKVFGKLFQSGSIPENKLIEEQRFFRMSLGDKTYTSKNPGYFLTINELAFDQPFSLYYDNHSIILYVQIYPPHESFNNTDLQDTLFAEFDLSDISSIVEDRLQTTVFNISDQAVGKLALIIEVFSKGPRFVEKVTSKILFQTVKQQKERQIKASAASKNIKNLMVNNALTNSLMTINYIQVRPEKQDPQIFNRQCFLMMRYGISSKAFTKVTKVASKENVIWNDYVEFMKNEDVKFEFFFLFYDDLGNIVCKAKGQIKYIVFDETINNHSIVLFDRRSNIYGNLLVKFIQKEVEVVNIQNKLDKKLREQEIRIIDAIEDFNKFKFQSKNNNRILSEKLRQLQLQQMQEEEQKMKPPDAEEKKKREEHGRFIDFLQREVIKIERQLKKREISQKRDQRKIMYQPSLGDKPKDKKFNTSMTSSQFKQNLPRIQQIDQAHIIPQNLNEDI